MVKRYKVKVNSNTNLEELLNEIYTESCMLLTTIQEAINNLTNSTDLSGATVDTKAKLGKALHDYITDKDRALKMKLDVAKILNETVKFNGDENDAIKNLNKKGGGAEIQAIDIKQLQQIIMNKENEDKQEVKSYNIKNYDNK